MTVSENSDEWQIWNTTCNFLNQSYYSKTENSFKQTNYIIFRSFWSLVIKVLFILLDKKLFSNLQTHLTRSAKIILQAKRI